MRARKNIGGIDVSYNPSDPDAISFVNVFCRVCEEQNNTKRAWIQYLQSQGIAAARPDDGWVDRVNNTVHMGCYPHFLGPLKSGDRVALGWPDKYRVVELVERVERKYSPVPMMVWRFTDPDSGSKEKP